MSPMLNIVTRLIKAKCGIEFYAQSEFTTSAVIETLGIRHPMTQIVDVLQASGFTKYGNSSIGCTLTKGYFTLRLSRYKEPRGMRLSIHDRTPVFAYCKSLLNQLHIPYKTTVDSDSDIQFIFSSSFQEILWAALRTDDRVQVEYLPNYDGCTIELLTDSKLDFELSFELYKDSGQGVFIV